MKLFSFFISLIFFSFPVFTIEIATFKLSYIIDKSLEFNDFINDLELLKSKMQDELQNDEKLLIEKKNKIEESKILFSEEEFNKQIENYNILANSYKEKYEKFNIHINSNIEMGKKALINEVVEITKELSLKNNFSVILNEDQYFLASDKIDISEEIIKLLDKKKLKLEIIELP